jgi:hypothetical protein
MQILNRIILLKAEHREGADSSEDCAREMSQSAKVDYPAGMNFIPSKRF